MGVARGAERESEGVERGSGASERTRLGASLEATLGPNMRGSPLEERERARLLPLKERERAKVQLY